GIQSGLASQIDARFWVGCAGASHVTTGLWRAFFSLSLDSWASVAGLCAPQLVQPRIPAAAGAVVLVAQRVLQVVVLVVGLGGVERPGRDDLGDDRILERLALLERRLGGQCRAHLLVAMRED